MYYTVENKSVILGLKTIVQILIHAIGETPDRRSIINKRSTVKITCQLVLTECTQFAKLPTKILELYSILSTQAKLVSALSPFAVLEFSAHYSVKMLPTLARLRRVVAEHKWDKPMCIASAPLVISTCIWQLFVLGRTICNAVTTENWFSFHLYHNLTSI